MPEVELHTIIHEVLNLYRYRVKKIPKLMYPGKSISRAMALENTLEHRHIVPIEISLFPEAADYWNHDLSCHLTTSRGTNKPQDRKFNLMLGWILARTLFSGEAILRQYEAAIDELGFRNFAESMFANLEKSARNKHDQIAICVEMFELSRSPLEMWTYGKGRVDRRPLQE